MNTQNRYVGQASYLATIGFTAMGGAIIGGVPGGVIGFTSAIIDEYLINEEVTDKHYFSSSAFWLTTSALPAISFFTKIFPSYRFAIHSVLYTLPVAASYLTNDFLDFRNKIETLLDSFLVINKFFDKKEIISGKELEKIYNKLFENPLKALKIITNDVTEIYNNKFLFTFIASNTLSVLNIVVNNLFLHFLASYSGNIFIYILINNHHSLLANFQSTIENSSTSSLSILITPLKVFLVEGGKIIGAYTVKNTLEFIIDFKQNSLFKYQYEMILEKSTETIIENGKKILTNDKGKEIIQNLASDLFTLLFCGVNKLNAVMSESLQSLVYLRNLVNFSPDAFFPYALSLIPMQRFLKKMARDSKDLAEKLSEAQSKIWEIKSDITDNIEQIDLRDGENFVKYKYNFVLTKENELAKNSEYVAKMRSFVPKIVEIFNQGIDIAYFGTKIITKQLDINQIVLIKTSIDALYKFLSNNINFQIENKDLIISKERIDRLFKIITTAQDNNANHTVNYNNKIIFKNYLLKLNGQNLVKIDNFEFEYGKHYAITGKSGCGKTSTLIDLKEGVFGALSSTGEISIGYNTKVMFVDQKVYLPKESSLLETIYFPNILQLLNAGQILELSKRVMCLFKELEIDGFVNDSSNKEGLASKLDSKDFKLSGGQEKKIAIIQAILNKPDVLIIDETFTGLDRSSLIKVERAITKYLPGILVLSVDHHASDNNYNNFYDSEVHFASSTITEKQITTKVFEVFTVEQECTSALLLNGQCYDCNLVN